MVVIAVCLVAAACVVRVLAGRRGEPLRAWWENRHHRHSQDGPRPEHRPIEHVAADLRRLGLRYHHLDPRTPFVKADAVRSAYDRVLGECCDCLDIAHLLGVLAPGPALDAERARVEDVLYDSGLRFPHAA